MNNDTLLFVEEPIPQSSPPFSNEHLRIQFHLELCRRACTHELGHFLAARACRVPVTGAGFGWGPKLLDFELGKLIISFVHYQSALTSEWTCQLCRDDRCITTVRLARRCRSEFHSQRYSLGNILRHAQFGAGSWESISDIPTRWMEKRNGVLPSRL